MKILCPDCERTVVSDKLYYWCVKCMKYFHPKDGIKVREDKDDITPDRVLVSFIIGYITLRVVMHIVGRM